MGLTSGRTEIGCYDSIGGLKNVFLFPYVSYTRTQILGTRGEDLTTFPATDIYEFAITDGVMNESSDVEGGLSYNQSLSFVLKRQDQDTNYELTQIEKIELRYIVEFNNGDFKIGGLFNGAALSFDTSSGGSKQDFNGYNVKIESTEEWQSAFITNLSSVGFTIKHHLLLEDGDDFLMPDGKKLILS